VVAFQAFALDAYDELIAFLRAEGKTLTADVPVGKGDLLTMGRLDGVVRNLREAFKAASPQAPSFPHASTANRRPSGEPTTLSLQRLVQMYTAPESHYLNFYGPPGTIRTIPYHAVARLEQG
jgi:adenylate cyclase